MNKISPELIFTVDPGTWHHFFGFREDLILGTFQKNSWNFIQADFNPVKVDFARQVKATDKGESFQNLVADNQSVVACTCVVAWTCNSATLEAEFRNGLESIPVGVNSPSIGGWIVWPPVIQAVLQ